jgi:hypothetical protein
MRKLNEDITSGIAVHSVREHSMQSTYHATSCGTGFASGSDHTKMSASQGIFTIGMASR